MSQAHQDEVSPHHIAIVGMACRMPGADNIEEYWNNLRGGVESLSHFTDEELLAAGVDPEQLRSPHYVRTRGVVRKADHFDAAFFGFTPRDAELLDPQQRFFLECAWHALEDAAYDPAQGRARVGVFGGIGTNWHLGEVNRLPVVKKYASGASVVTSNDKDYVTTRVSFKLGLTGPSVNVQCACSTSLVATMLGINSLREHQCDLVLAGGATIEIPETKGYLYQEGGMESPDGRCRPFDAQAKGTVFSRGAGVVVLKRLADARRDRDHIYAVILDGAINNDGGEKLGFTAPSISGQVEVAVEALERAGISADSISFIEAHGTATPLGDPIEVSSLSQTFRHYTERKQFCALGSVKGNIGHTDVASGVASLIKTALALRHGELPASLNFDQPNPKIDFPNSPFFVNTELRPLTGNGAPPRALLNSFGVGGTNACLVLEAPPAEDDAGTAEVAPPRNVVLLSAKSETALTAQASQLKAYLERHPDLDPTAVAYSLQVGRKGLPFRRAVVFADRAGLLGELAKPAAALPCPAEGRPVAFAFPGQGNQFVGMAERLYQHYPVFRHSVDECADFLRPLLGVDLRALIFAKGEDTLAAASRLNQTCITQPSLFVISYAQARLWQSWGIEPAALIGHSVGEYVAACLAGVFSLPDALTVVARRGQLIQDLPGGAMLAILLGEQEVLPLLSPGLAVAACNGPQLTVVAGPYDEIAALEETLKARKQFFRHLDTSHAFHSPMMDPALPAFARVFDGIRLSAPTLPIASTLTGQWLTDAEATDPDYWVRHVRRPVRFSQAVQTLFASPTAPILLECGPGHSLASAAKYHLSPQSPQAVVGSQRSPTDAGDDLDALLGGVGALWAAGRAISWEAFYGSRLPPRVSLPGYPFERQKYALDFTRTEVAAAAAPVDRKKTDPGEWFSAPGWKRTGPATLAPLPGSRRDAAEDGDWLLFDDGGVLAEALAEQLTAFGKSPVRVSIGTHFGQQGDDFFTLRPGLRADYDDLAAALKAAGRHPNRVVHLWNAAPETAPLSPEQAATGQTLAFFSPLYLEQALIKQNLLDDLRLLVVTSGVFSVIGEPVTAPLRALGLGPSRVLVKEFPAARGRFIDIGQPEGDAEQALLASRLIAETRLETDDQVVAYRAGHRWVESWEPVYLDSAPGLAQRCRDEGVYLVTGGLNGLGLFFAGKIAAAVRAPRLVLTFRSALPPRQEWASWRSGHDAGDAVSRRIAAIEDLEAAGAQVLPVRADVADAVAMAAVVQQAEAAFGPISGVIHSAGTAGGGIIALKTEAMAAEVLDPKVTGTLVLDRLFQDRPLEFFLLFSSITAILGEAGRVDYCAANAFLDALAHYRAQSHPGRVTAINWGAWGEIGMAARWEETKARKAGIAPAHTATATVEPQSGPLLAGPLLAGPLLAGARLEKIGQDDKGQEIYSVPLNPAADWPVAEHHVVGIPTLVGATFLDLLHRFALRRDPAAVPVVENAYFLSPLMFPPGGPRQLALFVTPAPGKLRVAFRSRPAGEALLAATGWQEHFIAELRLETPERVTAAAPLDLAALRQRLAGPVDLGPLFPPVDLDPPFLWFGSRWDSLKERHPGEGEWLARLELAPEHRADLESFAFHPALTDLALAAGIKYVVGSSDTPYLPYGYKRVTFFAPAYTPDLWSHLRLHGAYRPGDETLSFDVSIRDGEGRELLRVDSYNLKRVAPDRLTLPTVPPAAAEAPRASGDSKDILPEEGLEALNRLLGHAFQPQLVVCASSLHYLIGEESPSVRREKEAGKKKKDKIEEAPATVYSRPALSTPYVAPENEIEKAIAEIWQGILGTAQIGVNDNFTELGGNSLLAVQTVANIADTFQVEMTAESFFKAPTIRGLADTVVELLVDQAGEDTLNDLISNLED